MKVYRHHGPYCDCAACKARYGLVPAACTLVTLVAVLVFVAWWGGR